MWEVNRGVEDLFLDEERAFLAVHKARQDAATVAQRRYEAAHGLSAAPVPFQVPVSEVNEPQ